MSLQDALDASPEYGGVKIAYGRLPGREFTIDYTAALQSCGLSFAQYRPDGSEWRLLNEPRGVIWEPNQLRSASVSG